MLEEIKTEAKVYEYPQHFLFKRNDKYPKKNVEKMLETWEEGVQQYSEWVDKYDESLAAAQDQAAAVVDEEVEKIRKRHEEHLAMDKEELKNTLYKDYMERIKVEQEDMAKADVMKEQVRQKAAEEFNKTKQEYMRKKQELEGALKLWSKPSKR